VFSLGCVLHELCWGALPGEPLEPLTAPVPASFRAILDRCVAGDPGQRFVSADDVTDALVALAASSSATARAARSQTWRLRLATIAAVALAAGLTARELWPSRIRNDTAAPARCALTDELAQSDLRDARGRSSALLCDTAPPRSR
jgi:hypothetical protein